MIRRHLVLYFLSRGFAAFGNLLAVAIFTRLAGPEIYGHYVVMFAAALVISGFSVQWIRYAFFNHYRSDDDRDFFASFVMPSSGSPWRSRSWSPAITIFAVDRRERSRFAAGALLIGLVDRALRRDDGGVPDEAQGRHGPRSASPLKAILVLALGTRGPSPGSTSALALAAGDRRRASRSLTIPAALTLGRLLGGRPSWIEIRKLVGFGWPLDAVLRDRRLRAGRGSLRASPGLDGAAATGAYGALSDLVRASFTVLGERDQPRDHPARQAPLLGGAIAKRLVRTLEPSPIGCFLVVGIFLTAALIVVFALRSSCRWSSRRPSWSMLGDRLLPVIMLASCLLVDPQRLFRPDRSTSPGSSRLELVIRHRS